MNKCAIFFTLFLSIGLIGCSTTTEMLHRDNYTRNYCQDEEAPNNADCLQDDIKGDYRLAFIEIDDQGHFHDREQVANVLKFIKDGGNDQRILIFAHGWHHDAQENDNNLISFRKLLKSSNEYTGKKTTGIYIGWRGESINWDLLNILTFWDRKNVSSEVGEGALLEFLLKVEQISKDTKSKLVTIGHSFGASAVYSSIKNLLIERAVRTNNPPGFGDLVVLVNPAVEGTHYATFRDIIEEKEKNGEMLFPSSHMGPQPPKILIATSESDKAVKWAFVAGRWLSTFFEQHRDYKRENRHKGEVVTFSQKKMDVQSVGSYEEFITHHLDTDDDFTLNLSDCNPIREKEAMASPAELHAGWDWPYDFGENQREFTINLVHKKNSSSYNPYWIVKVDEKIIPNHNDILRGNFVCFIRKYLLPGY